MSGMGANVGQVDQDTGERFNFTLELHMKLARGGSTYVYVCADFGIRCTRWRDDCRVPFSVRYIADRLPGQTFTSLAQVVAALRALPVL